MDAPNRTAWAVAVELASESKLDWATAAARYASHRVADDAPCDCVRLHVSTCPVLRAASLAEWLKLTPEQMTDAYLADCARRQVDPGPLPSLWWNGPDRFGWCILADDAGLYVAFSWDGVPAATWSPRRDLISVGRDALPREIVGRIFSASTVAAKAMGT